jgi:hypothetical protein
MSLDPLTPSQVDDLLRPDPRARSADLLVLRDALTRMAGALEQLADAVVRLHDVADRLDDPDAGGAADAPRGAPPAAPPRAD